MRLTHLGHAMNLLWGPLLTFATHNYADNYSPIVHQLYNTQTPSAQEILGLQETTMPTLQEMHRITGSSPRSTAMFFLLKEELSYRHLYRVDRAQLGNFRLEAPRLLQAGRTILLQMA